MKFHIGQDGYPRKCNAKEGNCPLRNVTEGRPTEHYSSIVEAFQRYEEWVANGQGERVFQTLSKQQKPLNSHVVDGEYVKLNKAYGDFSAPTESFDETFNNLSKVFPDRIVSGIAEIFDKLGKQKVSPLTIVPAGSKLYGTQLPNVPVHDYDFTVFASPFKSKRGVNVYQSGDLDLNVVDVTEMSVIARKSLPFTEGLYASKFGRGFGVPESSCSAMFSGLNVPVSNYFDTVDRTMRSNNQSYVEPVSYVDKNDFKNFKHSVRWGLYMKRYGNGGADIVDPRLTDGERDVYFKSLSVGQNLVFEL